MQLKQVIVFRKDIQMNKGKMIAQGAHAAMMCLIHEPHPAHGVVYMETIKTWSERSMAKIVVAVDTLEELNALEQKARDAGLLVYAVIDSGKTVFDNVPTKTCIAIGPAESESLEPITGALKLL